MTPLTHFHIEKLHGNKSVDIEIVDNKLVLVGENGTGKTTIINLIYYFLSEQWARMKNLHFESISATVAGHELTISKKDLADSRQTDLEFRRFLRHSFDRSPYHFSERVFEDIQFEILRLWEATSDKKIIAAEISKRYGFHPKVLTEVLNNFLELQPSLDFPELSPTLQIRRQLRELQRDQILYLPTYRRIEQELEFIFPQSEINEVLSKIHRRNVRGGHIELIEFGMKDVDERISDRMSELSKRIGAELSNLTGSYLSEVVGGQYKTVSIENIKDLESSTVESMLGRIGDNILPEQQKAEVRMILEKIKETGQIEEFDQKVIAHFLLKLFEVHRIQADSELSIKDFVDVCNEYLVDKQLFYDNKEFKIEIRLVDRKRKRSKKVDADGDLISLQALSSGEKQIVSLFSHLYLSTSSNFFVMIDEPELSLSVTWQKRFLPDIIGSGRCSGLIAVTHSPFIFENQLDAYTKSINQFIN